MNLWTRAIDLVNSDKCPREADLRPGDEAMKNDGLLGGSDKLIFEGGERDRWSSGGAAEEKHQNQSSVIGPRVQSRCCAQTISLLQG